MNYNEQQLALMDWIRRAIKQDHKQALQVIARAGCGKTTMLMEMAAVVSQAGCTMGVYAYNKPIAQELKDRINNDRRMWANPPEAATLHSAGMAILRQSGLRIKVDDQKVSNILRESQEYRGVAKGLPWGYRSIRKFLLKAVGLVRMMAAVQDWGGLWHEVLEESNIQGLEEYRSSGQWMRDLDRLSEMVGGLMKAINTTADKGQVDFDDLLYQPLRMGITPATTSRNQVVGIDEAQDCSWVRIKLASLLVDTRETGPRILVYVGDPAQSIYGFTGALPGAMDRFGQYLTDQGYSLDTLHLSHTYRCPKAVVRAAQRWVPEFTAGPDNPEGEVVSKPYQETLSDVSALPIGTAVLCRNTGPLLKIWLDSLSAVAEGNYDLNPDMIPATQWRVSIETGPIRDYLSGYEPGDSLTRVSQTLGRELERELEKEDEKKNWSRLERLQEVKTVVEAFLEAFPHYTVTTLIDALLRAEAKRPIDPVTEGVTLMTCHRAKGKEFRTVYLLAPNLLMPSKRAKKPEDREQEANLEYVATTRAKHSLIRVICEPSEIGRTVDVRTDSNKEVEK